MKNNEVEITITDELRKALVQLGEKHPGMTEPELIRELIRTGLRKSGYDVPGAEEDQLVMNEVARCH